ncbi:hypothetical protein GALMADRAFT_155164 [Galerina marginata CBS 339.88]|uniref:Uncharacterized protein n=1 Tax=Galerina marginata (strain CBS 339.88) TaxID=685588 RepID=A0A067T4W5_GALM3|nr:hypothetical protein GALMADRAFT_155164 [Galerina marginata CBS 339.88]
MFRYNICLYSGTVCPKDVFPPEYEDETGGEEHIEVEPTTGRSADPTRNAFENLAVANDTSRMSENYGTSSGVSFSTEYHRDQHILLPIQHPFSQPHTFAGTGNPTTAKQGRLKRSNNKRSLKADPGPLARQNIGRGEQPTTANQTSKNVKKRKRTNLELDLNGRGKQSAASKKPPIEAQLSPMKEEPFQESPTENGT